MLTGSLGERIAAYRRRRGLSQATLAGLVGRSESWLSQVERGVRSVDRLSTIADLARVLRVDVEAVIGRPWALAPNGGQDQDELEPLRQHFTRYDHLLGHFPQAVGSPGDLRSQVAEVHRSYQAADYRSTIASLPEVLSSVDARQRGLGEATTSRESLMTYVSAYVVAAKLLTKLGATDMAMVAADRAASVSLEADSLSARAMAAYQVACALLRADRTDEAEHLAVTMAEQAEAESRLDNPGALSFAGALWLIAAIIAGRRTQRFEAFERLRRADNLAKQLGHDANHAWTAFGPTNVAIHRVSVAAELGDAGEALDAAAGVDVTNLPEGLRSRRAQMHIDLAWAQTQRKRDAEAVLHLLEAEQIAAEAVRYSVVVRELIRECWSGRAGSGQVLSMTSPCARAC